MEEQLRVRMGRVIAGAVVVAFMFASDASAQSVVVYTQQMTDKATTSIEYEGEGWRNLRKLYISVRISDAPRPMGHFYVVCGTDKIIMPHDANGVGTTYNYPGKNDDDEYIFFGDARVLVDRISIYVSTEGAEQQRMRSAVRSACTKDPATRIEPADLPFSTASKEFGTLVASRFSRTKDKVVVWYRTRAFRSVDAAIYDSENYNMKLSVIEPEKGTSLSKILVDCSAKTLAQVQWIEYDEAGDVTDSYIMPDESIRYRETVPESVGEHRVDLACMIS